jgi:hypothetical protein
MVSVGRAMAGRAAMRENAAAQIISVAESMTQSGFSEAA